VLTAEVMASSFVSPDQRIEVANSLLSIKSGMKDDQTTTAQEVESRASDRIVAIAFALTGACVVGTASAVSVLTRNPEIIFITSAVALSVLGMLQFGNRISSLTVGRTIHLALYRKGPK
jgi:hypothetical protein